MKILFRFGLIALLGFTQAQEISLTGRVVDGNSSPVEGASVSLATAAISGTTDASGTFSLVGVSALKQLDRPRYNFFNLQNGVLTVNLAGSFPSKLEVYGYRGQLVTVLFEGVLKEGDHTFKLPEKMRGTANGVYLLRMVKGEDVQTGMFYFENGRVFSSKTGRQAERIALARESAAVDVLTISKAGYSTAQVDVESYQGDMGDITLTEESKGRTAGCGSTPPECDNTDCSVQANGKERTFYVDLPNSYDSERVYPVVFNFHPLGGSASGARTMYRVNNRFPEAIYISPEGLIGAAMGGNYLGWGNSGGEDEEFTRGMVDFLKENYCVDESRIFSTGFSYGGSMSFTAACNMSDIFRAIGAMSGAPISGATCANTVPERKVAVWATHGTDDEVLRITMAEPMVEALRQNNGCSAETQPVDPSPCVAYQGCDEGYPVVWCPREGDEHSIPSFAANAIGDFFSQF